jgi:hypothetical protein
MNLTYTFIMYNKNLVDCRMPELQSLAIKFGLTTTRLIKNQIKNQKRHWVERQEKGKGPFHTCLFKFSWTLAMILSTKTYGFDNYK